MSEEEFILQWKGLCRMALSLTPQPGTASPPRPGWLCRVSLSLWRGGAWAPRRLEAVPAEVLRDGLRYDFPYRRLEVRPDALVPPGEVHWFLYS